MAVCFAYDCNHSSMRETCKFFHFSKDNRNFASVVYGLMLAGLSCLAQLSNVFISLLGFTCISVRNYVCLCGACRKRITEIAMALVLTKTLTPALIVTLTLSLTQTLTDPPTLNSGCLVAQMPFHYAGIMTLQKPCLYRGHWVNSPSPRIQHWQGSGPLDTFHGLLNS